MCELTFAKIGNEHRFLVGCTICASALLIMIVLIQYYRYGIFGTTLMLGWDSPSYIWLAKYILTKGPIHMIQGWSFPYLYTQLLAFLGYLTGDLVLIGRILPIAFCTLLIYANSKIVLKISRNIFVAGLTAFLTVLSVNVLRVFSDLNRNLMAFSLAFVAFLLIPNLDYERPILNKKWLFFIFVLFVIAGTHLETYVILAFSLLLYGLMNRNWRKFFTLIFASATPVAVLISVFPAYFFGYMNTVVIFQQELTFNDIALWTGGSWTLLVFLVVASYLFWKSRLRNDELVSLVFSWCFVIFLIVASIGLRVIPFSREFALRGLYNMPTPLLLALAVSGCRTHLMKWQPKLKLSFGGGTHSVEIGLRRVLLVLIVFCIIVGTVLTVAQNCDVFLTPFISHSSHEKIIKAKEYFTHHNLSVPIVIFRGYPPINVVSLYRNYLGAEIGEHFAYYGDIPNLFRLLPSQPKIDYDPYLSQLEEYYLTSYYNELIGNITGTPPSLYYHDTHVTNETLKSHPILIVTPEFYNEEVPCFFKPFCIGEGIYVIPPNSTNPSGIPYGPEVTVVKNGTLASVRSEYCPNPSAPSVLYLKVNGSSGYTSYNFTTPSSDWAFLNIEQGDDVSFPEKNPKRINSTKATIGNDPADALTDWSTLWSEQNGALRIDTSSKKEGFASLKVSGKTDSWGCLSVKYDSTGTWNLSGYSSIGIWAKCNESAIFSISLVNSDENSRTFWYLKAEEESVTSDWKRFVANLTDWFSQTPGFNISAVDWMYLYVYSDVEKDLSFWIDDLTIDISLDLETFVYKDRVPTDETVVAYFYTRTEDG